MTDFEKGYGKQLLLIGAILAAAFAFSSGSGQFAINSVCFAWGGALIMWTQTVDRHGYPKQKKLEPPTFGDFIHPLFVGGIAATLLAFGVMFGVVLKLLARWMSG